MQAVILAGGRGKRLRPVTDYVPKPLIPIRNVPIIEWQIRHLKRLGVRDVIICAGYRAGQIIDALDSKFPDVKITFSIEKTPLGTGGAIKKISGQIKDETFFAINGDIITDIDIRKMRDTADSIAYIPMRTKYGTVLPDGDRISDFLEKKELPGAFMNAGIYHLSKRMLRDVPKKGDLEKTVFPRYAKDNRLYGVRFAGALWHSIDSYKDIEECSAGMQGIIK